jgi:hypothetical protein
MKIAPMRTETSGEVGAKYDWGGKDGGKVTGYVKGEVRDDKGNSAKVEVQKQK